MSKLLEMLIILWVDRRETDDILITVMNSTYSISGDDSIQTNCFLNAETGIFESSIHIKFLEEELEVERIDTPIT